MSGIEEVIAVVGGTLIVIGCAKLSRKIGIKINKRKLRSMLKLGFETIDYHTIKKAISGLLDYDSRNNSKKLNKYLGKIVEKHNKDDDKMNINETNLNEALIDFSKLETIFDETEEEMEEQNELLDEKLTEIQKRRKEVLIRRNLIKMDRIGIIKKKQRRTIGAMG